MRRFNNIFYVCFQAWTLMGVSPSSAFVADGSRGIIVRAFSLHHQQRQKLFAAMDNDENDGDSDQDAQDDDIPESIIKVDDGGSNLTDRFKYKVNALMGTYDPQGDDDENQEGNILNALLAFPVRYSFNIVGKTNGDDVLVEKFVAQVKEIVLDSTDDTDGIECLITPRTKNFTKVTIEAKVESAAMIKIIYDNLEALELTVMRF